MHITLMGAADRFHFDVKTQATRGIIPMTTRENRKIAFCWRIKWRNTMTMGHLGPMSCKMWEKKR